MMLKHKYRMRYTKDFHETISLGYSCKTKIMIFFLLKTCILDISKIGFIAPKSIGKAVNRNLIKRKFRSILFNSILENKNLHFSKLKTGYKMVTLISSKNKYFYSSIILKNYIFSLNIIQANMAFKKSKT